MRILRISLLGEPRLMKPDGGILATPGPKAMALMACLASARDMRMGRSTLVELLWSDARSTSAARHALRQCLVRLRVQLGVAGQALAADDRVVWLEPGLVAVDVAEMLSATTEDDVTAASVAIRGRFCAGLDPGSAEFEAWLRARRSEYDRACAGLHGRAAALFAGRGDHDAAIAAARRRLDLEPFQDDAYAALIALCVRLGRRQDAAEAHALCHQLFREELGVAPGPQVDEALSAPMLLRQPARSARAVAMPATNRPNALGAFAAGLAVAAALLQLVASWPEGRLAEPARPEISLWVAPASAGPVRQTAVPGPGTRQARSFEGGDNAENRSAIRRMLGGTADYAMLYPVGC